MPDGKTVVDLEVDQFVPYLLDTGDTAIHKPSSSSRCYPVVLSQNHKSLDNLIGEDYIFDAESDSVDPSQCQSDRNCGPFTLTDLERKDDHHCAVGGEVLATECVEFIFAAK